MTTSLSSELSSALEPESFQSRVDPWLMACFGEEIARDKEERNHRFLEEALELVQSAGCTESDAHLLVGYVYGRPAGDMPQEVGGVMTTLAALCLANDIDMHEAGETELSRIWTKVEKIRAKQAAKPKHSPLPEAPAAEPSGARGEADPKTDPRWPGLYADALARVKGENLDGSPRREARPTDASNEEPSR